MGCSSPVLVCWDAPPAAAWPNPFGPRPSAYGDAVDELLLVGYRVLPPSSGLLTLSSCLVDAVPDDETWFPTAQAAARHLRPGTRVLAMGVSAADNVFLDAVNFSDAVNFPDASRWPGSLAVLGYELISPTEGGFHSWRCFQPDAFGPLNAYGLVDDLSAARQLAGRPDSTLPPLTWFPAAVGSPGQGPVTAAERAKASGGGRR